MYCACAMLSSVACSAIQILLTIFGEKIKNIYVFRFSLQLLSETFLILRTERDIKIFTLVFVEVSVYTGPILIKIEFCRYIFLKIFKYEIS